MKASMLSAFLGATIISGICMVINYPGSKVIALTFAIISIYVFFDSFRRDTLFIEKFISIFLFLGFFFKFSALVLIKKSPFNETLQSIDHALILSTTGLIVVYSTKKIRQFFYSVNHSKTNLKKLTYLYNFYIKNRIFLIVSYLLIIFLVPLLNFYLGIYQRGMNPVTILPFKLNSIFEWLLLFGLSSISSFILYFEIIRNKNNNIYIFFAAVLQNFNSSISMLSRGMIFNSLALVVGIEAIMKKITASSKEIFIGLLCITILYGVSIKIVEDKRLVNFSVSQNDVAKDKKSEYLANYASIIYNRWVGIEEVLIVEKAEKFYFIKSITEKASTTEKSNFDTYFLNPNLYSDINTEKNHYISTPGLFAFAYYSKSIVIFIIIIFSAVSIFTFLEIFVTKTGVNNVLFTSLIGEVLAFRLVHFGYAPLDTYKLVIAVLFNTYIFILLNNLLKKK